MKVLIISILPCLIGVVIGYELRDRQAMKDKAKFRKRYLEIRDKRVKK